MKSILLTLLFTLATLSVATAQTCQTDTIVASAPTERFTDNGDGTVTDDAAGLMWKICSEGQTYEAGDCLGSVVAYSWQGALQRAAAVNAAGFAGHDDWRLPNHKELASIVERQCVDPAINLEVFPATPSHYVWSASPSAGDSDAAWSVHFYYGFGYVFDKSSTFVVRLVRGGQ